MHITTPEDEKALGNLTLQIESARTLLTSTETKVTTLKKIESVTRANITELQKQEYELIENIRERKAKYEEIDAAYIEKRKEYEKLLEQIKQDQKSCEIDKKEAHAMKEEAKAKHESAMSQLAIAQAAQLKADECLKEALSIKDEYTQKKDKLNMFISTL